MTFEEWLETDDGVRDFGLELRKEYIDAARSGWNAAIDACLSATGEPMDQFFMWESMKELKSNAALTGERTEEK